MQLILRITGKVTKLASNSIFGPVTPNAQDSSRNYWIAAILLYAIALIYQGYQYGMGDQVQILPVLYAQDHPGAYGQDHYVQAFRDAGVNERTIFHGFFRYAGYQWPWMVFGWHVVCGVMLCLAWLRIGGLFLQHFFYQVLAVVLILILGFHTSTGSNELYYNSFIPSLPAKVLASWGIYFWLRSQYRWWAGLLIASTLVQPLVGLQVFLLSAGGLVVEALIKRKVGSYPWKWAGIYLLLIAPWIIWLAANNGAHGSPESFMEIMRFRLSHHFFASTFEFEDLGVFVLILGVVMVSYKWRIRWCFVWMVLALLVYEYAVEIRDKPFFLYMQWWKSTIWLEAFALLAIAGGLERMKSEGWLIRSGWIALPLIVLILVGSYRLTGWFGEKPDYIFPWAKTNDPEIEISLAAKTVTSDSALFIVPYDFTAFKWYSKRSQYVDYKSMLHQEAFLTEWYDRVGQIYQFSIEDKAGGFALKNFSNQILSEPAYESIALWKQLGITHFIAPVPIIKGREPLARNEQYGIFSVN